VNHGKSASAAEGACVLDVVWYRYGIDMASTKVTFTLDAATIRRLRDAAARLAKPQSAVVREAIQDFHDRIGKLSERERTRLLRIFDQLVPKIPRRPVAVVEKELDALRRARHAGGRRTPAEKQR
jgi:hypothetical protein